MTEPAPPAMAGWNLGLRFALEMAALVGIVLGGRELIDGAAGQVAGVVAAIAAAAAWGTFNVPGDPSRSGRAPVAVPGLVRLCVELDVLALGAAGLVFVAPAVGVSFVVLVTLHYVASAERVRWLVANRS